MKAAISTLACDGWTLEKTLQICRQNDIQAIEIRMGIHPWSQLDLTDDEYRNIYSKITASGLTVSNLGTGVVVRGYDKAAFEELERCAQIARLLHCKGLRIMLGYFRVRWSEPEQQLDYEGIVRWLKEADALMTDYGTEIWIETHNEFATGKSLNKLLKDSGVKQCKVIWDIMHPIEAGEQPADSYRWMCSDLIHVHIKDGRPWDDADMASYQYTHLGEGDIDIEGIIEQLVKNNYEGYFSLEWEGIWRKELQGENFSPEEEIAVFSKHLKKIELSLKTKNYPLPPEHTHPRLFMRKSDYSEIRKKFSSKVLRPVYYQLKARQHSAVPADFNLHRNRDLGLYGNDVFESIKANAFFYLLEEDMDAGRTAISKIFAVMGTIDFTLSPLFDKEDMYTRAGGELLVVLAVVYDWCFDLLKEEQLCELRRYSKLIMSNMEVGYPPVKQGAVTAHSGEAQLMRDIISLAIAIYDEENELYHLAAKRLFEEFIPARDFIYQSHAYHQGDFYGTFRYQWEIYLAWIYRRMGYEAIFSAQQQFVPYSWLYARLPDGQLLKDGDSVLSTLPKVPYWNRCYTRSFMLTASFYRDPYLQQEYHRCDPYQKYEPIDGAGQLLELMLFYDPGISSQSTMALPCSKEFYSPYGGLIARTTFNLDDPDAVVCSFKIGNYMFKNHQHRDSGQFQIYYKDILALDSGLYYSAIPQVAYGSEHRMQYLRHTIAHNCMLFRDMTIPGDAGGQRCDADDPHYLTISELLQDPHSCFADTLYTHVSEDVSYASADFSAAYEERVKRYIRTFVFLRTNVPDIPAVILVYDYALPSHAFIRPYWLLHTQQKPVLENNGFTAVNKGKLTGLFVSEASLTIETIGGEDHAFDVFGVNYPGIQIAGAETKEGSWRIQVSAPEGAPFCCLTAMAVSDKQATVSPAFFDIQQIEGRIIVTVCKKRFIFNKDEALQMEEL